MINKIILTVSLLSSVLLVSCDQMVYDLSIVNNTKDSLYFYVHPYRNDSSYTWNFAYIPLDYKNKKWTYEISFAKNLNESAVLPNDSARPGLFNRTWKNFATQYNGLTVLFYKKQTLETLEVNLPLTENQIYKRIDLTLDSLEHLNYTVTLKE